MTAKQYLKMADEFSLPVEEDTLEVYCRQHIGESFGSCEMYAAHAINSHDELVAENERLVSVLYEVDRVLSEMQKNGVFVYGLDDLIDEVSLSIQSRSES